MCFLGIGAARGADFATRAGQCQVTIRRRAQDKKVARISDLSTVGEVKKKSGGAQDEEYAPETDFAAVGGVIMLTLFLLSF